MSHKTFQRRIGNTHVALISWLHDQDTPKIHIASVLRIDTGNASIHQQITIDECEALIENLQKHISAVKIAQIDLDFSAKNAPIEATQ